MSTYYNNIYISGIIAKNLESPSIAVVDHDNWGRKASPGELPDLRYCSDMYSCYWVRDYPNVNNLRFYGAKKVVNDDTVLLAARALREAKKRVIVVTNNAIGRPKFGERPKNDLNIFFQIENVPANDVTDDKPQGAESRRARVVQYEKSKDSDGVRVYKFSS
ncbi:hypothetical protein HBH98_176550 [Parastagonospora nodorum]|nr:hypothetical protein HBH98_176550 [Parastagonospora nodorum]KAH4369362.1 hypothetical protein HBH97_147690 [Parastagonospora nodorum]KAH4386921.1 hypothetical protein HBH99_168520 [Parastagonospora nodorum]KAH5336743.1 hypothetical protein HBI50_012010 [Parastagonospora nodorum]